MNERTPGQWRRGTPSVGRWRIVSASGRPIADVNSYNEQAEGNLEHILTACNAHEELVAALKDAPRPLSPHATPDERRHWMDMYIGWYHDACHGAIQKAEGGR